VARRRVDGTAELDMIPVMSLIVHLIPMLLLSVRFLTLAQVQSQGPVVPSSPAPSAEAFAEQAQRVVSVRITGEGFVVGGSPAADPRIPCVGACAPDTYDYAALNRAMVDAKRLHPEETRVVLAPEPTIAYDVMVRVMDATRTSAEGGAALFSTPLIAAGAP
jgi:biopolymer transport protein ExbD